MADAPKNWLDELMSEEGESVVQPTDPEISTAELDPENPAGDTPAEAAPAVEEEPVTEPETPAAEPEPELPEAAAPAAEAAPTTEPAPVAPPEKAGKPDRRYPDLRKLQRELAEEKAKREALEKAAAEKAAQTATETTDDEIVDPIEQARRDAAEAKEIAQRTAEQQKQAEEQQRQAEATRQLADNIRRDVDTFRAAHPDYDAALNHLVESRREEYELTGDLDAAADQWIERNPDLVERHLQEEAAKGKQWDIENYDDIRAAAKDMAFRVMITNDQAKLIRACQSTGKSVPHAVYELAKKRGHQVAAPAAPAAPADPQAEARARVQKAKEAAERTKPFTQKIPAMSPNPAPLPKAITKRSELMKMPDKDQDALIAAMDAKDPGWFERLED